CLGGLGFGGQPVCGAQQLVVVHFSEVLHVLLLSAVSGVAQQYHCRLGTHGHYFVTEYCTLVGRALAVFALRQCGRPVHQVVHGADPHVRVPLADPLGSVSRPLADQHTEVAAGVDDLSVQLVHPLPDAVVGSGLGHLAALDLPADARCAAAVPHVVDSEQSTALRTGEAPGGDVVHHLVLRRPPDLLAPRHLVPPAACARALPRPCPPGSRSASRRWRPIRLRPGRSPEGRCAASRRTAAASRWPGVSATVPTHCRRCWPWPGRCGPARPWPSQACPKGLPGAPPEPPCAPCGGGTSPPPLRARRSRRDRRPARTCTPWETAATGHPRTRTSGPRPASPRWPAAPSPSAHRPRSPA